MGDELGTVANPALPAGEPVRFTWNVQAYEEVRVVAGTLKAFRISVAIEVIGQSTQGGGPTFPEIANSPPGMRPRCGSLSKQRASAWT